MPEFRIHRYEGARATVTWDSKRCVHAEECVHRSPAVFDARAKPWVSPDAEDADALATTIAHCPTGALHIQRKDGGAAETTPTANTATLTADGPLYFRGSLTLKERDGSVVLRDTRMALCRCGASGNKPLCDGSHRKSEFRDAGTIRSQVATPADAATDRELVLRPELNGPLHCMGPLVVTGTNQRTAYADGVYLCRCGHSENKPYCDGTHRKIGFVS